MICRAPETDANDTVLLITQNDHAIFSGFLAGHIGNEQFVRPSAEAITATAAHDVGWPLHDDEPTLNQRGQPLHVFEITMPLATRIWSASAERAMALGPYAALLVSMHQLNLSDFARQQHDLSPHERVRTPRDVFELNKFQHWQVELQETLRKQLSMRTDVPLHLGLAAPGTDEPEDLLRFHFRMLTLCDRLSLALGCGKALFPKIDQVYARPGEAAVTLSTRMVGTDRTMVVDPWPFDVDALSAEVPCRRVSGRPFESEQVFRAEYAAAPVESIRFELHR
jgi:hypothetical protein